MSGPAVERRLRITRSLLFALTLPGCGYLEQRLEDAGDMFYAAAGAAYGLSAAVPIAPWEISAGFSRSNLYGWEGRSSFHRRETVAGFPPLLLTSFTQHVDSLEGPWWRVIPVREARGRGMELGAEDSIQRRGQLAPMPLEPRPYTPRVFNAGFGFLHVISDHSPREELSPDKAPTEVAHTSWGVGLSVTPGILTLRVGIRPFGVITFLTGWLGFHLLPPYRPFSNELDGDDLLVRGILTPEALADPVAAIVFDLRHKSPVVRAYSAKVLGGMREPARAHVDSLRPLTADPDLGVRVQAIVALHRIDPGACPAKEALIAILRAGGDEGLAAAALESLGLDRE